MSTVLAGELGLRATGLDIVDRNSSEWPRSVRAGILDAYPRLDLAEAFSACIEAQATAAFEPRRQHRPQRAVVTP